MDSKPGSTGWIEDVEERRGAASAPDGRNSSLESCHLLLVRLLCASVPGCLLTEVAGSQHENVVMTDGLFTAFHPCSGLHRMLVLVCKRHFWVWSLALPHYPFALSTHLLLTPSFLPSPPPVLSVATIYGSDLCTQASWDSFLKHLCPQCRPPLHASQAAQVSRFC